jgi:hypothetical protein
MATMRGKISISTIVMAVVLSCVSPRTGTAEERFVDNEDGTVTDTQTGLMWAKTSSPGDVTWYDAQIYCNIPAMDSLYLKYDDWRMPTVEEVRTLYDKSFEAWETDCGRHVRVNPVFEVSCDWIWSADLPDPPQPDVRSVMAYVFDLGRGYHYADRMVHKKHMRALPVRGSKTTE